MFHTDRWSEAFFAVSGENAQDVFQYLKVFVTQVKGIHGAFFGHGASAKLEKVLLESVSSAGITDNSRAALYAIRYICLLVEKNCFKRVDTLMARIEQKLDEKKGILDVTVESAFEIDGNLKNEFARLIKEKTSSAEVNIKTRVKPELLGGYLLRIGSFYVDSSLKGQIEKFSAELNQAVRTTQL